MHQIFLLITLISINGAGYSSNQPSNNFEAEVFVEQYISDFNQEKDINRFFHFPVVWLVDDTSVPKIESDASKELIDSVENSVFIAGTLSVFFMCTFVVTHLNTPVT